MTSLKRCIDCAREFPATLDYFYAQKKGLAARCKTCHKAKNKQYYKDNTERIKVARAAKYAANPEPAKARANRWRKANPERKRTLDAAYASTHKEEHLLSSRRYVQQHPDRRAQSTRAYRQRNPDKVRTQSYKWADEHPYETRLIKVRRRARQLTLPDTMTGTDWERCLNYFGHQCAVCGKSTRLHADHWIPVTDTRPDNPGTVPTNIVPLCHSCNASKSNKDALTWLQLLYGDEQAHDINERIEAYFRIL